MGGNTMKMNKKGFTLIELLIVVAIIAILAAIAIPQFAQYRIKGYNASANTDLRNVRTSEEALFADWQRYGSTENVDPTVCAGGAGNGTRIDGATTSVNLGTLCTTEAGVLTPRGLGIAVGQGIQLQAGDDAAWVSYSIMAKHLQGDTIYAAESESTSMFRQQNPLWKGHNLNADVGFVASTNAADYAAPWSAM
jgi:type IV pilus assembly protein PilA